MHVSSRTYTRTTQYLSFDDIELELTHKPAEYYGDNPLVERIGNSIVVAYLVDDSDCEDPMKNADCQGDLYTRGERVITDNESELEDAFGIRSGEPNVERGFNFNGERVTLMELAIREFEAQNPELDLDDNEVFGEHEADIEGLAFDLYRDHWQAIAGPYVVPASYHSERGSTMVGTTTWDGDYLDLPNAVWVADKGAIENIDSVNLPAGVDVQWRGACGSKTEPLYAVVMAHGIQVYETHEGPVWGRALAYAQKAYGEGTAADLHTAAIKYADNVLSEYQCWCNGEVGGVVVEVFDFDEDTNTWEANDKECESCWGMIGWDYCKAEARQCFDAEVNRQKAFVISAE